MVRQIALTLIISCSVFLYPLVVISQSIHTTELTGSSLPFGIKCRGEIKNAVQWADNEGEHIVVTTETGIYLNNEFKDESYGSDAELFAYHYIIEEDSVRLRWKVYDYIRTCPVDIEVEYLPNSFAVTDLDKDGIAEVWLMYKTACHGDVSPAIMKVIMYEGQNKYAMRGENRVQLSSTEYYGGEYTFSSSFLEGPEAFRDYARKLWQQNIVQVWD